MSLQLKVIAAFIAAIVLVLVQISGCAAPAGSAAGKKIKKPERIPLTPYQLRHATIGIPEGVIVRSDFYYKIANQDKHTFIDVRIKKYDGDDIQAYFDAEIAKLRQENEILNITKQKTERIGGNKALVLHINYKTNADFPSMEFSEYVGILCKNFYVLFKAWGFLDLFEPGEHLWQAMYRSFRSDDSQPYKLPFGSFILPKEMRDRSSISPYFPNEDDYTVEINYITESRSQEIIRDYKRNILGTFLTAKIFVLKDETIVVDGRKGRYFETRIIALGRIVADMLFHIPDGDKTVLQIEMGSNQAKIFKRYRPQMEAILRSIKFDETAAGGEE